MPGRLIVLAGVPGAGKSTYAAGLGDRRTIRLNTHAYRERRAGAVAHLSALPEAAAAALRAGRTVIVDAVNATPAARRRWLRLAAALEVPAELHVILTDPTVAAARDHRRRHRAGADIIDQAADDLAYSLASGAVAAEGWDEIVVTRGEP